jgi:hypothetical protein
MLRAALAVQYAIDDARDGAGGRVGVNSTLQKTPP